MGAIRASAVATEHLVGDHDKSNHRMEKCSPRSLRAWCFFRSDVYYTGSSSCRCWTLVLWVPPAAVTTPDEALPPGGPGTMAVWNSPGSSSPGSRVSYPLYGEVIAGYWCCYRLPNLPNRNRGGQRLAVLRNACGTPHKTSSLVVSVTLGTFCPRADRPSTPRDSEEDQKLIKH